MHSALVTTWLLYTLAFGGVKAGGMFTHERGGLSTLAKSVVKQGIWEQKHGGQHIPRILHYVYMSDQTDLQTALATPDSKIDPTCYNSCLYHHAHWTVMVWDHASVRQLVQLRYPEYANFFDQLHTNIYRSDVARYLVVLAYGGLYLDTDITCYKATDGLLGTTDTVLQGSNEHEGLTNSAFASVSGASIIATALEIAKERIAEDVNRTESTKDPVGHVLYSTGPFALKSAFDNVTGVFGQGNRRYEGQTLEILTYHVWPRGTWFGPCFRDEDCSSQLQRELAGYNLSHSIAGTHHFKATWIE